MELYIPIILFFVHKPATCQRYEANWDQLDQRTLPEWYDKAKIGILVHWGIYSVPAYGPSSAPQAQNFWVNWKGADAQVLEFMEKNYPQVENYEDFLRYFTAKNYDPEKWVSLFKKAGARYIIITSKHNDGFALFNSEYSAQWNSVHRRPHLDLLAPLQDAVTRQGLEFGIYYNLHEWNNPLFLSDLRARSPIDSGLPINSFVTEKLWPEAMHLIEQYRPSIFWVDGDLARDRDYWDAAPFVAWVYNDSPVKNKIVMNDRWGVKFSPQDALKPIKGRPKHGDFYTYYDKYNPRILQRHKWENVFSLDKQSWGYRTNMGSNLMTIGELIENVVSTVSCGGNVLMNIGVKADGSIPRKFVRLLTQFGEWMDVNGEAIYATSPWREQHESGRGVWYTCKSNKYDAKNPTAVPWHYHVTAVYAIILKWPEHSTLRLKSVGIVTLFRSQEHHVQILGWDYKYLHWAVKDDEVQIQLPKMKQMPSRHAWALKITRD